MESETQRHSAITAGLAIVIMTIAAVVANDLTIETLIVEDNASATLANILESKSLFNIGVFSWIVIMISDIFAAWGLYMFFKPVNENLSLITAWFRLVYVAMLAASVFNLIYVIMLTGHAGSPSFEVTENLSKPVMFYVDAFKTLWSVSLVIFGFHALFLGYLSLKSPFIPKILGILLIIAFAGYTLPNLSNLFFPEYKDVMEIVGWIFLIPMLAEVALGLWLLIIGLRVKNIHA